MTSNTPHTVIIGGGVIGGFSAWYLRQTGREVTLIDKGRFGKACSHGNCGYVSPSHVIPLAHPGQISKGIKGMLSRQTALRIEPKRLLSLWPWLLKFALRCNERDMMQAGLACHPLLQSSAALYRELIEAHNLQIEWRTDGLLFVYKDQKGFDDYSKTNAWLKKHFQVSAEPFAGAALTNLEPALKPGLAGAWLFKCDAQLRPDRLMSELRRLLDTSGVKVIENCEMKSLKTSSNQATAVETSQGELEADEVLVATGAWTPLLKDSLGIKLPIQPGKGYSITMPRPKICPKHPMILEECHVGITPFDTGYRVGGTMEFAGYDTTLNQHRLNYLRAGAAEYLIEPTAEPVQEEWCGWRPMTADGIPFIDRSPRFNNVWVAAGHSMLGISMGTGTGKLVAEMISGQKPHVDLNAYRIQR
ncbi:MAG TPA: FAD-dependent oxidoreductase [Planctomycetaceae bacterium]|nr:FAD-dependent oxidoreductase [Planctomycetaceae bacterium]